MEAINRRMILKFEWKIGSEEREFIKGLRKGVSGEVRRRGEEGLNF